MIDFNKNAWYSGVPTQADREAVKEYEAKILEDLGSNKTHRFHLGVHLIELFDSRAYIVISNGQGHAEFFWKFCEQRFKLDKSSVSRYMNVVDEFGDGHKGLHKRWRDYSWSVLVEMLPMSVEAREFIKPEMTCKQVRELKKGFVATSQREAKPNKNVVFTASDKKKIDAMKEIYGFMSTDELMLELYRLREELMQYQSEAALSEQDLIEDDEDVVEI